MGILGNFCQKSCYGAIWVFKIADEIMIRNVSDWS